MHVLLCIFRQLQWNRHRAPCGHRGQCSHRGLPYYSGPAISLHSDSPGEYEPGIHNIMKRKAEKSCEVKKTVSEIFYKINNINQPKREWETWSRWDSDFIRNWLMLAWYMHMYISLLSSNRHTFFLKSPASLPGKLDWVRMWLHFFILKGKLRMKRARSFIELDSID